VFLLQNLVLVALALVVFWVTFFPKISEAITGNQVSVGPSAFEPFVVPLALIVVLLAGIGPILAWRRVTVAGLRRSFAFPVAVGFAALGALVVALGTTHLFAILTFAFAAFVTAVVLQEFWRGTRARHAITGEPVPLALVALVRRNRRRYGGYIVHAGLAVLLVGVAASSSFKHESYATLRPGQSTSIDGYRIRYLHPTVQAAAQRIDFGAVLAVSKGSQHVATLRPSYGMYPSQDPTLGPIGRFFNGSVESQIGLKSGFMRDIWTVPEQNIAPIGSAINRADAQMEAALKAIAKLPPSTQRRLLAPNSPLWTARNARILKIAATYTRHPWPVTFLLIVSPLVMWLWIGGLIMLVGALVSLRPVPSLSRLKARSRAYAPSAQQPSRRLPVREPA
jgi:cytochrome c-type biogenesis protein CcmF